LGADPAEFLSGFPRGISSMKRFLIPLLFMVIGIADFIYGILRSDAMSLAIGALLVGISLYIIYKDAVSSPN